MFKYIFIDKLMLILIVLACFAGLFKDILIYFYLILFHELGHFLLAKMFRWEVDKIYIYPYGGCTKFNTDINRSMREEFLILLGGPIFQIIFTYLLVLFVHKVKDIDIIFNYSKSLLFFNLLPIYPLDGGRLINLLFNKIFSFRKSFILSFITSLIILVLILGCSVRYNLQLNFIMIIIFLLKMLIEEYKKKNYYYNKFLLERYINSYDFVKFKKIKDVKEMMRDKKHIFKTNSSYMTEKEFLKKIYKNS